eukprot:3006969-Amphidinium_carterae.2
MENKGQAKAHPNGATHSWCCCQMSRNTVFGVSKLQSSSDTNGVELLDAVVQMAHVLHSQSFGYCLVRVGLPGHLEAQ